MIIELSRRLQHESEADVEIGVRKVSFGSRTRSAGLHPSFEPNRKGLALGASRAIHSPYRGTPMSSKPSPEAQGLQSRCSHMCSMTQTHRGEWCDCFCSKTATATMLMVMAVENPPGGNVWLLPQRRRCPRRKRWTDGRDSRETTWTPNPRGG